MLLLLAAPCASGQQSDLSAANVSITTGGAYRVYQSAAAATAHTITINTADSVTLYIVGLNISSTTIAPINIMGGARVGMYFKGANILTTTASGKAGIQVSKSGISIACDSTGTLSVTGGANAAGIGSAYNDSAKTISIRSGYISVMSGTNGSAIGAGSGADAFCSAVKIYGGTIETGNLPIAASMVRITGGSVKTPNIIGQSGDPKNNDGLPMLLGKLPNMPDARYVRVDDYNYNISANHNGSDTLFLYMRYYVPTDNNHTAYVLLGNGTMMTANAVHTSGRFEFGSASAVMRIKTGFDTTFSYQTPYNDNPLFSAAVHNVGSGTGAPLNSAGFDEVVIKINSSIVYRNSYAENSFPAISSQALSAAGLPVGRYAMSVEYGGSIANLPCRLDSVLTIIKAAPYVPPVDYDPRYMVYGERIADATPALGAQWRWLHPDSMPYTTGTQRYTAIYLPADLTNYDSIVYSMPVVVRRASSTPAPIPLLYASYGDTLKNSPTMSLPERWQWLSPNTIIDTIGLVAEYSAVYTPEDTVRYDRTITRPSMIVGKGKPNPPLPQNLAAPLAEVLSSVKLDTIFYDSHSSHIGTWRWVSPDAGVGNIGTRLHAAVFTHYDTAHYDTIVRRLRVIVSKPRNFIKISVDNAYPDTVRGVEYLFTTDDCIKDSTRIYFEAPPRVTIYAVNTENAMRSTPLFMERPDVYQVPFTIITPDTDWIEYVLVERRFALTNLLFVKRGKILILNNSPATNGGYSFDQIEWYRGDSPLEECRNHNYCIDSAPSGAMYWLELSMAANGRKIATCSDTLPARSTVTDQPLVYPNPAPVQGVAHIVIPQELKEIVLVVEVRIYDAMGTLKDIQVLDAANPRLSLLNITKPGVYILKMNIGEARLVVM
jgi:hypothetical protein